MTGVFEMMTGPYIPTEHVPLDVLPWNREEGYEVFSSPPEISDVDEALFEAEGLDRDGRGARVALIYPYGYHSYGEYFAHLQGFVDKYEETAPELADSIRQLIESIKRMNVKEDWSVVRYVGHEYDDKPRVFGLTRGRCYYWPCSKERPVYEGVIDDEEFTSYLYPCDAECWEIVLDPTGMAARALAGDADTLHAWYPEMNLEEHFNKS